MPKLLYLDAKGLADEREWDAVYEMEDGTERRVRNPERAKFEQEHRRDRNWLARLTELEKRVAVLEAKLASQPGDDGIIKFSLVFPATAGLTASASVQVSGRGLLSGVSSFTVGRGRKPPRERLSGEEVVIPGKTGKDKKGE